MHSAYRIRPIVIAAIALILAACSGLASYNVDCAGDLGSGYTCNQVDVRPYIAPTPMPPTIGRMTIGPQFDSQFSPGTDVVWTVVQSPGAVDMFDDGHRSLVVSVTEPGDYHFDATWIFQGQPYNAPFTLTVTVP